MKPLQLLLMCGVTVQGRKTAAQVQRLEALHAKQQAVLRRKTEEAEAARKRLHVSSAIILAHILRRSNRAHVANPESLCVHVKLVSHKWGRSASGQYAAWGEGSQNSTMSNGSSPHYLLCPGSQGCHSMFGMFQANNCAIP